MVHAPDLPPTPAPGSTPRLPESRHWGSALRANPPIFVPSADATMQAPASHRAIAQHRLRTGTTHDCPWNQTPPSPPNVRALRPTVSTTDPLSLQVLPQVQPASSFFYKLERPPLRRHQLQRRRCPPPIHTSFTLFLQFLPQVQPASSFFYNLLSDTISSDTDACLVTRAPGLALLS